MHLNVQCNAEKTLSTPVLFPKHCLKDARMQYAPCTDTSSGKEGKCGAPHAAPSLLSVSKASSWKQHIWSKQVTDPSSLLFYLQIIWEFRTSCITWIHSNCYKTVGIKLQLSSFKNKCF